MEHTDLVLVSFDSDLIYLKNDNSPVKIESRNISILIIDHNLILTVKFHVSSYGKTYFCWEGGKCGEMLLTSTIQNKSCELSFSLVIIAQNRGQPPK